MSALPPPVRRSPPPTVVLAAAPGSLDGVDECLRKRRVRVLRIATVSVRPVPATKWLTAALERASPDTVVVTSRAGVEAGVRPWLRAIPGRTRRPEFWGVGPRTARALRDAGVRRVRTPGKVGAAAVVRSLGRRPPRVILHLRSDRAGPGLARSLRRQGHRVLDRVVYRLGAPPRLPVGVRRRLAAAHLLVVTSPSGLVSLRRLLGHAALARIARDVRLVVLGERSRFAARRLGFRAVSIAPASTAQRFTGRLLRELRHATA